MHGSVKKTKHVYARILDIIKSALIVMLTVSMLTTAGFYINIRQNESTQNELPWEKLKILENGGQNPATYTAAANHFAPVQITVTDTKKSATALYDEKITGDIYSSLTPSLQLIFDTASESKICGKTEGESIWTAALGTPTSVYIRYAGDYPYTLIKNSLPGVNPESDANAGQSEEAPVADIKEMCAVRELVIIYRKGTVRELYAVTRDSGGNTAVFYPPGDKYGQVAVLVDKADFSAYTDIAGIVSCKFIKNDNIAAETGFNKNDITKLKFPASFMLLYEHTYSSEIEYTLTNAGEDDRIDTDSETFTKLFDIFRINVDNADFYTTADGATYMTEQSTLKLFFDGRVEYTQNKGEAASGSSHRLHISRYLGLDSDYYTLYDKIKAADLFLDSLPYPLDGGEMSLLLSDIIAAEDGTVEIHYSLYFRGIRVRIEGSGICAAVRIGQDSIDEALLCIPSLTAVRPVKNMREIYMLERFEEKLLSGSKTELNYDPETELYTVGGTELVYDIERGGKKKQVTALWNIY